MSFSEPTVADRAKLTSTVYVPHNPRPHHQRKWATLATSWQQGFLECKVELELRTSGQVTLRFSDPGYTLAQAGEVTLGTRVTVGAPGAGTLITAEATSLGVEQREGEQPELVVVALDKSHRLGRGSSGQDLPDYVLFRCGLALATAPALPPPPTARS